MTQLNINHQTAQKIEAISQQTQKSVDEVLDWLVSNYAHTLVASVDKVVDDTTWTDEEIEAMLQPKTPLTGKEIVEAGLVGESIKC